MEEKLCIYFYYGNNIYVPLKVYVNEKYFRIRFFLVKMVLFLHIYNIKLYPHRFFFDKTFHIRGKKCWAFCCCLDITETADGIIRCQRCHVRNYHQNVHGNFSSFRMRIMKSPYLIRCIPLLVGRVCDVLVVAEGSTTRNDHMGHSIRKNITNYIID